MIIINYCGKLSLYYIITIFIVDNTCYECIDRNPYIYIIVTDKNSWEQVKITPVLNPVALFFIDFS